MKAPIGTPSGFSTPNLLWWALQAGAVNRALGWQPLARTMPDPTLSAPVSLKFLGGSFVIPSHHITTIFRYGYVRKMVFLTMVCVALGCSSHSVPVAPSISPQDLWSLPSLPGNLAMSSPTVVTFQSLPVLAEWAWQKFGCRKHWEGSSYMRSSVYLGFQHRVSTCARPSQPLFIRHRWGNAEAQAFLAQQSIATATGTIRFTIARSSGWPQCILLWDCTTITSCCPSVNGAPTVNISRIPIAQYIHNLGATRASWCACSQPRIPNPVISGTDVWYKGSWSAPCWRDYIHGALHATAQQLHQCFISRGSTQLLGGTGLLFLAASWINVPVFYAGNITGVLKQSKLWERFSDLIG